MKLEAKIAKATPPTRSVDPLHNNKGKKQIYPYMNSG